MITRDDVIKAAGLARLALTDEETELYTGQIQRILGYVEKLSELDTTGVTPTSCTAVEKGAMREDRVVESIAREEALANAPVSERGCFKVPKIIE